MIHLEQDGDELDSVAHGGPGADLLEVPPEKRLGLGEEYTFHKAQNKRQQNVPVAKKPACNIQYEYVYRTVCLQYNIR